MDFLKGYIGLTSSQEQKAESGLYVDQLPDISAAFIEKIVQDEESKESLWDEIETRGLLKFRTLFIREVNKYHKVNNRAKCECLIQENKELLATAIWWLLGAEVLYTRQTASRMNSYTTLDRSKAKEMREYFDAQFEKEIEIAVRGIDIHQSACFECETQPEIRDLITTAVPVI
jgi:hypothetical protein